MRNLLVRHYTIIKTTYLEPKIIRRYQSKTLIKKTKLLAEKLQEINTRSTDVVAQQNLPRPYSKKDNKYC